MGVNWYDKRLRKLGFGLKVVEVVRIRGEVICRGPYSYASQMGLISGGRWSRRVGRPFPCKRGWHFWSPENASLYGIFRDWAFFKWRPSHSLRIYVVEARDYRLMSDKAVARQIRFIRRLSPGEVRGLREILRMQTDYVQATSKFKAAAEKILRKVSEVRK